MRTSNPPLTLLAIDDTLPNLELIQEALAQDGWQILTASDEVTGLEMLKQHRPSLVLLDLVMPGVNGMELLQNIVATDPIVDVILMTAHYSTDSAVEAIQKGACDYLTKPIEIEKLRKRMALLVAERERRREALKLDGVLLATYQFEGIIGRSPLMLEVFTKIRRVAPHYRTVLVTGATGTGKELVARALHQMSPSASKAFAACNCSAITETLLESELFGYVRGAFTGAVQDKQGLFEFAQGGTVFLDEIGELPLPAQAKILRVLQNHEIQRVGSPAPQKVEVRVIAATNRNLSAMVREGQFREDLYYRLSMVEIRLPRLLDRKEDLPLLQRHFLEKFAALYGKTIRGITRRAQAVMATYSWPGNVRELENVIGNACMMAEGETVDIVDLPASVTNSPAELAVTQEGLVTLAELQNQHVLRVLEHVGGNKARASEILGVSRTTIYDMLARIAERQPANKTRNQKRGMEASS